MQRRQVGLLRLEPLPQFIIGGLSAAGEGAASTFGAASFSKSSIVLRRALSTG